MMPFASLTFVERVVASELPIPPSPPSGRCSGGVFVISGAVVEEVVNEGPVTTYGQNHMVLDN